MSIKVGDNVQVTTEARTNALNRDVYGNRLDESPLQVVAMKEHDIQSRLDDSLTLYTLSNGLRLYHFELEPYQEGDYVEC